MTLPRIGYVHSWSRTQDEGWVRAALDYYGVPYTYFADKKLRDGNLRAKYDVIVYPHIGGSSQSHADGSPRPARTRFPTRRPTLTPNLGALDSDDDIRGGMGMEGLLELAKFVQEGGTLITEGSTAALMAEYDLGGGVTVEHPTQLFARGTILRGTFADLKSPIAYGYDGKDLPVYFNQDPVLNAGAAGGGGFGGFGGGGGGRGGADANAQNITPNAALLSNITPLDPDNPLVPVAPAAAAAADAGVGDGGAVARQLPMRQRRPAARAVAVASAAEVAAGAADVEVAVARVRKTVRA